MCSWNPGWANTISRRIRGPLSASGARWERLTRVNKRVRTLPNSKGTAGNSRSYRRCWVGALRMGLTLLDVERGDNRRRRKLFLGPLNVGMSSSKGFCERVGWLSRYGLGWVSVRDPGRVPRISGTAVRAGLVFGTKVSYYGALCSCETTRIRPLVRSRRDGGLRPPGTCGRKLSNTSRTL